MTKVIAPNHNCWSSFIACTMDLPLRVAESCSTVYNDWKERTAEILASSGVYYIEVSPLACTQLPDGALVGAHVNGSTRAHIVIAKATRVGTQQAFSVFHDPSTRFSEGTPINPETIVLLCKLIR